MITFQPRVQQTKSSNIIEAIHNAGLDYEKKAEAFVRTIANKYGIPCSYFKKIGVGFGQECPHCKEWEHTVVPSHGKYRLKVPQKRVMVVITYEGLILWEGRFGCDDSKTRSTHNFNAGQGYTDA